MPRETSLQVSPAALGRPAIVWLRQDLRLYDQPAVQAALQHASLIPVFILDDAAEGEWAMGGASRWWLHHSLQAHAGAWHEIGGRLVLRRGSSLEQLTDLMQTSGALTIYYNRRYDRYGRQQEAQLTTALQRQDGASLHGFDGNLLRAPESIRNKTGKPFQIFTPYWRHCLQMQPPPLPLAAPKKCVMPMASPTSLTLDDLDLLPKITWYDVMEKTWTPGEAGARMALRQFAAKSVADYESQRDTPSVTGTSRLGAALHFGELSPRQVYAMIEKQRQAAVSGKAAAAAKSAAVYLKELGWREFAHNQLFHWPHFIDAPLRAEFAAFPWIEDESRLQAWCRGQTGYPIVDAGMRELWRTGWMHNRVRMIVASFLVKHLLIDWRRGATWFWDTLVDADLANNSQGWQWSAGCGSDAAPYFRIFNPTLQGEKFDPQGLYVRRWCPELAALPNKYLHKPWEAPPGVLHSAGLELGLQYPKPIVTHAQARFAALKHYDSLKKT